MSKEMAVRSSYTLERLVRALLLAIGEHGAPNRFGLMELETHFRGPACGAAGGIVRRWPADGFVSVGYRLRYERVGNRTEVEVTNADEPLTPELSRTAFLATFARKRGRFDGETG